VVNTGEGKAAEAAQGIGTGNLDAWTEDRKHVETGETITAKPGAEVTLGPVRTQKPDQGIGTGASKTAAAAQGVTTGAPITANAQATPGANYPRIAWKNYLIGATAVTNDANSAFARNALTLSTWDKFTAAASSVEMIITLPTASPCDYIALAGLNSDVSVLVALSVGAPFTTVGIFSLANRGRSTAELCEFPQRTIAQIKLILTNAAQPTVANVMAGLVTVVMRPTYSGVSPLSLSSKTKRQFQISDSGQFVGNRVIAQGVEHTASFRHLTDQWYRAEMDDFAVQAQTRPFYYSWNPEEDPHGVIYAHATEDLIPTKMGIKDMLQLDIKMVGHR